MVELYTAEKEIMLLLMDARSVHFSTLATMRSSLSILRDQRDELETKTKVLVF